MSLETEIASPKTNFSNTRFDNATERTQAFEAPYPQETRTITEKMASLVVLRTTLLRLGQRLNEVGYENDPRRVFDGYEGDALGLHYYVDRNIPAIVGNWAIVKYSELLAEVKKRVPTTSPDDFTPSGVDSFDPTMIHYLALLRHELDNDNVEQPPIDGILLIADEREWWGNDHTPWVAGIEESQRHYDIVHAHPDPSLTLGKRHNLMMCVDEHVFRIGLEEPLIEEQYLN